MWVLCIVRLLPSMVVLDGGRVTCEVIYIEGIYIYILSSSRFLLIPADYLLTRSSFSRIRE